MPGGVYFFTVVTHDRAPIFSADAQVEVLRGAFGKVMIRQPFQLEAMVVLPDHLHCIWRLPQGDADFSGRWREIKKATSRVIDPRTNQRKERSVWQRRFWEHLIRDERDWRRHLDYIHYNPVKHGLVESARDWPWSSFERFVRRGLYEPGWGEQGVEQIVDMELE